MSALAARRAAAALAASSTAPTPAASPATAHPADSSATAPAPAPTPTRGSDTKSRPLNTVKSGVKKPHNSARWTSPSPLPAVLHFEPEDESEEEDEEGESSSSSSAPSSPKTKKRKLNGISRTANIVDQKTRQDGKRAFSPSAPVAALAQEENDSSDAESDDALSEDVEYEGARDDVDEGRVDWGARSAPPTSGMSTPGPSRTRPLTNGLASASMTASSNFVPVEGENIHGVSEDDLQKAGLSQDQGISGPGVLVSLAQDETLVLAGMYTLTPLQNSLSLLSTRISPSSSDSSKSYPVYAPTSHPLPIITSAPSSSKSLTSGILSRISLPSTFKVRDSRHQRTVLLIRENRCGLDGLRYGAVPGFAHIWLEEKGAWGLRGVHPVIGSFPTPVYPYITPDAWDEALSTLPSISSTLSADEDAEEDESNPLRQAPIVALVKGPKRSGKSTFARAVLNRLLGAYQRVAWLECDLGQGEFGCGGVVGLWVVDRPQFGPPFTHPATPVHAYYLGTYTPLTCPDEYITAIQKLIEYYKYELQYPDTTTSSSPPTSSSHQRKIDSVTPLVVNTQGWVKGLGEELLRGIEEIAQPTEVFDFQLPLDGLVAVGEYEAHQSGQVYQGQGWTTSPIYTTSQLPYETGPYAPISVSADVASARRTRTHTLVPAPVTALQARYTPADIRVLSTITYFHSALVPSGPQAQGTEVHWDVSVPLLAQRPYITTLSCSSSSSSGSEEAGGAQAGADEGLDRVYLIGEGSEGVLPADLPLALNGSIVALASTSASSREEEESHTNNLYVPGRAPPESSTILGLALIRAIRSLRRPLSKTQAAGQQQQQQEGEGYEVQLLTPLPAAALSRCNALIKNGAIELPLPGLMDWRTPSSSIPTREKSYGDRAERAERPFIDDSGVEVVGGERRRFRKNLMRKGM